MKTASYKVHICDFFVVHKELYEIFSWFNLLFLFRKKLLRVKKILKIKKVIFSNIFKLEVLTMMTMRLKVDILRKSCLGPRILQKTVIWIIIRSAIIAEIRKLKFVFLLLPSF